MCSTNGFVPDTDRQIRYIAEWFNEWSELQRSDFLPILAEKFGSKGYVNGLLPGMDNIGNLQHRPPSLFQCRVKLFKEWSDNWDQIHKDIVLAHIKSIDPEFVKKYDEEILSTGVKAPTPNDNDNGIDTETVVKTENDENIV